MNPGLCILHEEMYQSGLNYRVDGSGSDSASKASESRDMQRRQLSAPTQQAFHRV
jgi:hypothetical protein